MNENIKKNSNGNAKRDLIEKSKGNLYGDLNGSYKIFDISNSVSERIHYLQVQKEKLERILEKLPEGSLLVAPGKTDKSFRYYYRKSPKDVMGEYLGKSEDTLKKKLALKKYIVATCKNMLKEIKMLDKIQNMNIRDSIIDTYVGLNYGVKKLINPIAVDDSTYIKKWQEMPYEGLKFLENDTTEYYSDLGERMRSKSEVSIANQLLKNGIPYKYECPIVRANGEKLYPDFTILDVKRRRIIYWEHLGRMGDMSYVSRNLWKLDEYKKIGIFIGINLFITYESDIFPLGTNDILRNINAICG